MAEATIKHHAGGGSFRLGDWLVEPQLNRVSNGDDAVHLEPKAMEVLVCLADHFGAVVPRRVLVDTVWSTEFITDSTLTHTVADLRRALADDARAPRFIETIPKRGYRLIAEPTGGPQDEPAGRWSAPPHEPLAVIIGDRVRLGHRAGSNFSDHFLFLGDQEIPLIGPTIVFGRGQEADIQFLVSEVSRHHARLNVAKSDAEIEDLGSKNGTRINDRIIDRPHRLSSGDAIAIGPTTMTYRWLSVEQTRTSDNPGGSTRRQTETK
jgi:DNA-binding winged helix-turn-helix (wHTH) protein